MVGLFLILVKKCLNYILRFILFYKIKFVDCVFIIFCGVGWYLWIFVLGLVIDLIIVEFFVMFCVIFWIIVNVVIILSGFV